MTLQSKVIGCLPWALIGSERYGSPTAQHFGKMLPGYQKEVYCSVLPLLAFSHCVLALWNTFSPFHVRIVNPVTKKISQSWSLLTIFNPNLALWIPTEFGLLFITESLNVEDTFYSMPRVTIRPRFYIYFQKKKWRFTKKYCNRHGAGKQLIACDLKGSI